MHDLPEFDDGLTPLQRRILEVLARKSTPGRRPSLSSRSVVEAVVGGRVPSLEADLVAGRSPPPDGPTPLSVYLELVQMAQTFRTRYPLVNTLGNFGTIDGDPPADAVFTRCGLSHFGAEALARRVPTLLVNGALPTRDAGTAGFLPHHLGEVLAAARALVEDPGLSDDSLLALVPGPDFPTGGVASRADAHAVDRTGEGHVRVRARIGVAADAGHPTLIVTEIPFLVRKLELVEELANGVRFGSLHAIADVNDDSDRHGIRIKLALRPGVPPAQALDELFARTSSLQRTLHVDMRARNGGETRRAPLAALLRAYVKHLEAGLAVPHPRKGSARSAIAELERLAAAFGEARRTSIE